MLAFYIMHQKSNTLHKTRLMVCHVSGHFVGGTTTTPLKHVWETQIKRSRRSSNKKKCTRTHLRSTHFSQEMNAAHAKILHTEKTRRAYVTRSKFMCRQLCNGHYISKEFLKGKKLGTVSYPEVIAQKPVHTSADRKQNDHT